MVALVMDEKTVLDTESAGLLLVLDPDDVDEHAMSSESFAGACAGLNQVRRLSRWIGLTTITLLARFGALYIYVHMLFLRNFHFSTC